MGGKSYYSTLQLTRSYIISLSIHYKITHQILKPIFLKFYIQQCALDRQYSMLKQAQKNRLKQNSYLQVDCTDLQADGIIQMNWSYLKTITFYSMCLARSGVLKIMKHNVLHISFYMSTCRNNSGYTRRNPTDYITDIYSCRFRFTYDI